MNASTGLCRRTRPRSAGLLLCCSLLLPAGAIARDVVDMLTTPFEDPLLSTPDALRAGPSLPDDVMQLQCPDRPRMTQGNTLTLEAAVDTALCHNAPLRNAWARIRVQAAQVGQARAAYLPVINLSLNRLRQLTTYDQFGTTQTTRQEGHTLSGNLNWQLLDGGGRDASRRMADDLLDAAHADYGAELQKTLMAVSGAYFDAGAAQAAMDSRRQAERLARQTVDSVRRRESQGVASHADTLQALEALARARLAGSRAEGDYEKAVDALVYAMGLRVYDLHPLALKLSSEPRDTSLMHNDLREWQAIALEQNQEIRTARKKLSAAKEKLTAVRSQGLPTLSLTTSRYVNGFPDQGLSATESGQWIIGLNLSIPLFDGFNSTYKVREQQAQLEVSQTTVDDSENQVFSDVAQAYAGMTAAARNRDAAGALAEAAREAQASRQRGFEQGVTDLGTLLDAQSALADAQQEAIGATAAWRQAKLKLIASTGILGRKEITEQEQSVSAP